MKSKAKVKRISLDTHNRLFPMVFVLGFAVVGTLLIAFSHAATSDNPIGNIEYCRLEGNTTGIYGWAHDSQAGASDNPRVTIVAGSKSATVPTDIRGYKDAEINAYLSNRGIQTASRYGFKASFSGIYKGSNTSISGTAINVGVGTNQPLNIHEGNGSTGTAGGNYYFVGKKVPDACLPNQPVPPIPPTTPPGPVPIITPPSSPPSGTSSGPGSGSAGTGTNTTKPPTTKTNPGSQGTNPTTPETTSPSSNIRFDLTIKLLNKTELVTNTKLALREADATSITDDQGVALFPGLTEASYTLIFTYQDKTYEKALAFTGEQTSTGKVEETINISELQPMTAQEPVTEQTSSPNKSSKAWVLIPLMLIAIGAVVFVLWRRRRLGGAYQDKVEDYDDLPSSTPKLDSSYKLPSSPPHGENNVGVSLKEMVIKSMREEAAKRHKED